MSALSMSLRKLRLSGLRVIMTPRDFKPTPTTRTATLRRGITMGVRVIAALSCTSYLPAFASDLQTTVQTSLNYHPALSAARADQQAAKYNVRVAKASFYPNISLELSTGQEYADNSSVRAYTKSGSDVEANRAQAVLRQLIFDGGVTSSAYDVAEGELQAAQSVTETRKQQVILAAVRAHLEVLKSQRLRELADDNVIQHNAYVQDMQQRSKQGVATTTDTLQAKARLAFAEAAQQDALKALLLAQSNYREVVGTQASSLDAVIKPTVSLNTLKDAIAHALANNPAVKEAAAVLAQTRAEFRAAKSTFFPRIDLEIRGSSQDKTANSDVADVSSQSDTAFAGLVLRQNLYAGGADTARKQRAAQRQSGAESLLALAQRDAREAARFTWHERAQLSSKLPLLKAYSTAVDQVLMDYTDQFKVNRRRLLDLLDRQVESFRAQSEYTAAYYDLLLRQYQLLEATGLLSAQFPKA